MSAKPHRRLLPVLFAIVALMLSVHQAVAFGHVDVVPHEASVEIHFGHEADHPLHLQGCCTQVFGASMPDYVAAFKGVPESVSARIRDDRNRALELLAQHFRPPRLD